MRRLLLGLLAAGPLLGQSWSLASRLTTPALYVAVETDFALHMREVLPDCAIARVLRDAGCAVPDGEFAVLSRVSDLCQGRMEIALGGADGAVVVHCELPAEAASKVQALIDDPAVVERVGEAGDVPVVGMRGHGASAGSRGDAHPAALYLGLSRGHLVVASNKDTVQRLLSGGAAAGTLAADADFRDLTRRVEGERPSLTVFGSWPELSAGVGRLLGPLHAGTWFGLVGALDARALLIAVRPAAQGLVTTVLLQPTGAKPALEGWLAAVQRLPLPALLADVPRGGVASITVACDPDALRRGEPGSRLAALFRVLVGGCAEVGLSLEQHVLQRLKGVGGVQLVLTPKQVESAYVVKAKSERDAQRLLTDCRRTLGERGRLTVEAHQAGEELVLPPSAILRGQPRLGQVRDSIVLATARGVVEQVALADRALDGKTASHWVTQSVKALGIGSKPVVAVVWLDLSALLPDDLRAGTALRQHAGCLRHQSDHFRLELFSRL